MKIAVVVTQFPVLSETFVIEQISGLIERGHNVTIHSLGAGDTHPDHPLVRRHDLMQRVRYAPRLPDGLPARVRVVLSHLLRGTHGSRGRLLASLNPIRFGRDARTLQLFAAALGTSGAPPYDAICAHFGPNGRLATALREIGAIRGPIVTVFHGFDLTYLVKLSGPRIYDDLLRRGELFLPVSERFAETLRSLGADPARVRVHHVGVDCRALTFVASELPESGPLRLLTVARLVEKKGIEFSIRAVAELKRRIPRPIRYSVIGEGPLRPELESLIRDLRLEDTVELLGAQHPTEARRVLRDSHVFLLPSVTSISGDQEGIPVVLMEAMASGIPVVSTEHSGIPELVQHEVTGLLAPERNPIALADRVEWLLEHPERRRSLCDQARRRVELEFDSDRQADRLVNLLEGLRA